MRDYKELLSETISILEDHGKTISDIKAVQGSDFGISVEDFLILAAETVYDTGYGATYIPLDLKVIGDNWWLERNEYDGSEWWEFKTMPEIKKNIKKVKKLTVEIGYLSYCLKDGEE